MSHAEAMCICLIDVRTNYGLINFEQLLTVGSSTKLLPT